MQLTVPVYQRKQAGMVELTTIGLGRFTRTRSGAVPAKVQELLIRDLKQAIANVPSRDVLPFLLKRGTNLVRLRLELNLSGGGSRRKVSGQFPLVLEPRSFARDRRVVIGYHPKRQGEWFPVKTGIELADQASSWFSHAWASLDDHELADLESDGKDLLKAIAFSGAPRTLIDDMKAKETGVWDDLRVDPARGRPRKPRGGLAVLPGLGIDLTATLAVEDPGGLPRTPHREQLETLLAGPKRPSVVVVGPPSSGKTTIIRRWIADLAVAEGYAAHQNLDRLTHVWAVSGKRLVAGMSFVGDWEKRCMELLEDVRGKRIVLYVPDLFRFGRLGRARNSDRSLADFFRGPVARGELAVVGEATSDQLHRLEEDAPAFAGLLERIVVAEATLAETFGMLVHEARSLEPDKKVEVSPLALRTVLEVGASLGPSQALPGRAVDMLRQVLDHESDGAGSQPRPIEPPDVVACLSDKLGLARALLARDASIAHAEVLRQIASQVLGQPEAVRAAADLVVRIKAGLCDPKRPQGVYLFTGPTGTGKTELAKCIAEVLYGSAARMVRFDMSEFAGPDGAARLVGDSFEPEGLLTRAVLEQPLSVVLLDEIDKAHPSVLNLLLQLFEDGRLTDAAGTTARFESTVVVMTSNLGARQREPIGWTTSPDAVVSDVSRAVRDFFPPELFNRIDRVVTFRPLDREVAVLVAEKELGKLVSRHGLETRNVFVQANRAVVERVAREAFEQRGGARSLKRFLEDRIGAALAEAISSSPRAALRMLYLFDAPGTAAGFVLRDEPLYEAAPHVSHHAFDALAESSVEELRARLVGLLPHLSSLHRAAAARAAAVPWDLGEGGARYWAETFADAVDRLRARVDPEAIEVVRTAPDSEPRWDTFEHGKGFEHVRVRVRMAGKSGKPARPPPSRDELLGCFARSAHLRRIADRASDPAEHGVVLELVRIAAPTVARFREALGSAPETASATLLGWMVDAYLGWASELAESTTVLDGAAVLDASGRIVEPRSAVDLARACAARPDCVAIAVTALGVRDALGLEQGCHVWQPLGESPEIVRLRVLPAGSRPAEVVRTFTRARDRFRTAVEDAAGGPPPSNPSGLLPMVRKLRFDPPRRDGALAPLELEDYVSALAADWSVRTPAEAIRRVLFSRTSRQQAAP